MSLRYRGVAVISIVVIYGLLLSGIIPALIDQFIPSVIVSIGGFIVDLRTVITMALIIGVVLVANKIAWRSVRYSVFGRS